LIDSPAIRPHIALVATDRDGVGALGRARSAGIPTEVVRWADYPDRDAFSRALADRVEASGAKGVVLAGFMRILARSFVERFPGRILNVHPSLLPDFPGARAVEAALADGVGVTGVTVHFVDEEVDHGPIVAQEAVPVLPGDDADTLHSRIKEVEHRLYPTVVEAFVSGALTIDDVAAS
jgi:phosphoribosylglycinamide formyltransferase-1